MSFNLQAMRGATIAQIQNSMNYQSFLKQESEIDGIRSCEALEPVLLSCQITPLQPERDQDHTAKINVSTQ
jgi:hypothetical protein